MNPVTVRRLKSYLSDEQLESFVKVSDLMLNYVRHKTQENLEKYEEENKRLLQLCGGKKICEIVPLGFW